VFNIVDIAPYDLKSANVRSSIFSNTEVLGSSKDLVY
jgi:hypothetical protein